MEKRNRSLAYYVIRHSEEYVRGLKYWGQNHREVTLSMMIFLNHDGVFSYKNDDTYSLIALANLSSLGNGDPWRRPSGLSVGRHCCILFIVHNMRLYMYVYIHVCVCKYIHICVCKYIHNIFIYIHTEYCFRYVASIYPMIVFPPIMNKCSDRCMEE